MHSKHAPQFVTVRLLDNTKHSICSHTGATARRCARRGCRLRHAWIRVIAARPLKQFDCQGDALAAADAKRDETAL